MNRRKSPIVYIGRNRNIHDQKFVKTLSEGFEVQEIYTHDLDSAQVEVEKFSDIELIIAGPLTDAISAIPLEVEVPILGISHAFDLNLESHEFPLFANVNRCSSIITDCRYISNVLRDTYSFSGNVYIIPWGCDREYFSKAIITFREKPRILVTRNWFAVYRNDVIISALEMLKLRNIDFGCTFIGTGPLLENQIQNSNETSIYKDIHFLGHQGKAEIRDAMADNWIYVSAASSDGTSVSLLEAMAAGMICITTDFPSNLEWIEHSISGFVFPNGDSQALALLVEMVSSLSLEEKVRISRAAKETILKRGDWRDNQKAFTTAVSTMVLRNNP